MTPGRAGVLVLGRDHIGHIVKMQFFFSFCLHWGMDQTLRLSILMMAKEESTKIVKFMTHGTGFLMLGHEHISNSTVNMQYLLLYQYIAHYVLLYLGIISLLSYAIAEFYLFYDGAVDLQMSALLTRSQCSL